MAVMVNGVTDLAVTILDGLDEKETLQICVALPENAKAYLNRLSELVDAPVSFIGNGPEREQTIIV